MVTARPHRLTYTPAHRHHHTDTNHTDTTHTGHVNPKTPEQVKALFERRGYTQDVNATHTLRKCASFPFLRSGLIAFKRGPVGGGA